MTTRPAGRQETMPEKELPLGIAGNNFPLIRSSRRSSLRDRDSQRTLERAIDSALRRSGSIVHDACISRS
jgi:hypothetical protein